MDVYTLTYQEEKNTFALILFVTEKRNRYIKTRKVAIGNKQKTYNRYDKINGSSPTVNNDSVFITVVIDAHDHRAV